MYGSVLLALMMTLVGMDLVVGPAPPAFPTLLSMAAVTAGVFVAGLALTAYVARGAKALERGEQRFLRTIGRMGKTYRLLVVAAYAGMIFGLRWPALAYQAVGGEWNLPAFALTVAPLIALWLVSWTTLYRADRRLRAILSDRTPAPAAAFHWTLPAYLAFVFRQYVLVILVPLAAMLALLDVLNHVLPSPAGSPVAALTMAASVAAATILAGPWMRLCWKTEPLPEGNLRRRLAALARRARTGIADILLWRTNHSIANGCMVGLLGPVRYILITDTLVLRLPGEQIEAVFAHEVAHVRFRHVAFYMATAAGAMGAAMLLSLALAGLTTSDGAVRIGTICFLAAFWWLGFGLISRRCEQEADLYAVRASSCPLACSPPNASRRLGRDAAGLCEHRVAVFVEALRRIARLNGAAETARGWRHHSIARRCAFLEEVLDRPSVAMRFERRLRLIKAVTLASALLAAGAAAMILVLSEISKTNHVQHPADPTHVAPRNNHRVIGLVDGNQVNPLVFRTPQLDRHADPTLHLHHRRLTGQRNRAATTHHEVAVTDPRGHTVAVDPKTEKRRIRSLQPG